MPRLDQLRWQVADLASGYLTGSTGVLTNGAYVGVANGTDAQRRLVSSDLLDQDVSGLTSDTELEWWDGAWAYLPSTQQQRRVANAGYTANSLASAVTDQASSAERVGFATLARPWTAVVAANEAFEIHAPFPVTRSQTDRLPSIHGAINQALRVMRFKHDVSFVGTGVSRLDASSLTWLTADEGQLIEIRDPSYAATDAQRGLVGGADLEFLGEKIWLTMGSTVSSGTAFTGVFWRPRGTWVKHGGTWATSAVGLVDESDECGGNLEQIALVAYFHLADRMAGMDPNNPDPYWTARRDEIAGAARAFMWRAPELSSIGRRREPLLGLTGYPSIGSWT